MSSIKCRRCGLTNWADQEVCKRCKSPIAAHSDLGQITDNSAPDILQTPANHFDQSPSGDSIPPRSHFDNQHPPRTDVLTANEQKMGLAIASMVLGILAFVTVILLVGVVFAPIGLALGIVAVVKAKRYPSRFGGTGFAIAGIVLSSIVMLWVPIIAAIAIPNLLAARRAANEGLAVTTMRKLIVAQSRYASQTAMPTCADLITLNQLNYIDAALSTGQKSGYRYAIENLPNGGCEMHATPVSASSGERSFYVSTNEGTIHVARRGGQRATDLDEIITNQR